MEGQTKFIGDIPSSAITRMHFTRADGHAPDDADAQAVADAIHAFWAGLNGALANTTTAEIQDVVPVLDQEDGTLITDLPVGTAPAPVVGAGDGGLVVGVGVRIRWNTASIRHGRHVQGGTYIVPSGGNCFGADGRVDADAAGALSSGASGLLGACAAAGLKLVVWSRANVAKSRLGNVSEVVGHSIDPNPSGLRRRRT
jgi:hypothetical protein